MEEALMEAAKAAKNNEVPVGAIVVSQGGTILGRGGNAVLSQTDPTAHAEILALREAAARTGNYRLPDCVLVCTLEPCLMCTGAIIHSRLSGLVYGAADARAGAISSCLDFWDLPGANAWHMGGILSDRCASLLLSFFGDRR